MYFTYLPHGRDFRRVNYDIWHTPGAFHGGNVVRSNQIEEARRFLEQNGRFLWHADPLEIRRLRGKFNHYSWKLLDAPTAAVAVYSESNEHGSDESILKIIALNRNNVNSAALNCSLPVVGQRAFPLQRVERQERPIVRFERAEPRIAIPAEQPKKELTWEEIIEIVTEILNS